MPHGNKERAQRVMGGGRHLTMLRGEAEQGQASAVYIQTKQDGVPVLALAK